MANITEKKPLLIRIPGEITPNELPITASAVGYDFVEGNYIIYATGSDNWVTAPPNTAGISQYWQSDAPGNIFTTGSVMISGNLNQAQNGLIVNAIYANVQGSATTASAYFAHAEGQYTVASGSYSHSEGSNTLALGVSSHAEGNFTTASNNAHAEGAYTFAVGDGSHSEGYFTVASGSNSHSEGNATYASGSSSHAEGSLTLASGYASHAEGWLTTGSGDYSHAEGHLTIAAGTFAHAEGSETQALEEGTHAEGGATVANALGAHAEGLLTLASNYASHAEGIYTNAAGVLSHAEGGYTLALGNGSHTEGYLTTGSGLAAHAQGYLTDASGSYSFAGGIGTIASGSGQSVLGQYNKRNNDFSLFVIGDGISDADVDRHDVLRVNTGAVEVSGTITATAGFSGSLTTLANGSPYLIAGTNITLSTGSNGAVTINTSGSINNVYWQSDINNQIFTTGSIAVTGSMTGSNLILTAPTSRILAPNGALVISSSAGTFITGSLIVSGTRSSLGTDNTSVLFNGDLFVSGGIGLNDYIQLKPVNLLRIPTNTTASYIYTSGSTNDMYFTQYQPGTGYTNTTRLRWLESTLSTGLLHGGVLSTTNGSTTFNITSGSGLIVSFNASTTTDPYPTIQFLQWPAYTSQSLTYLTSSQISYIGINSSGGIIQRTTPFDSIDYETSIPIGRVLHQSGSVTNGTITSPHTSYGLPGSHDVFVRAFGPLKLSGHVLAASGSTLGLTKTGGDSYVEGRNYTSNPSSPDLVLSTTDFALTSSKIYREYVSGSTPVIDTGVGAAGYTTINPGQYNNNGTLASVPNNNYSIQRVYWFPNSVNRALFVYYGTATYGSIASAQSGIADEIFIEGANTAGAAILVGYIIVREDATNLSDATRAKIIQAPLFRAAGGGGGVAGGGTTTPGGLDTYVQFNDGGSTFGGVAGLTFNKTTNTLTTTNLAVSSIATVSGNVILGDAASDTVTVSGSLKVLNGLQVAGTVPGISAPYNNTPVIIDLASGQVYGPVIRSAAGSFNFAGHSLDQGGTYLGGVYGLANNPGSLGFVDGINFATVGSRNLGFNINNTLIGKFSTSGLEVTGSTNVSNGVNIAAGGIQVAGTVPNISSPYNNSPVIIDLASGQSYGAVIRSATGQFNYSALSFDQNGTYLGGIYNIANDPGNGYSDGMNITTAGGRKIAFFVNGTTAVAKITTAGLQVTGSVAATLGFSGSLTKLTNGSDYLLAGPNITLATGSTGQVQISGSASGTSGQVQFNNSGLFGGATNVSIGGGDLILAENTSPTTPAASTLKLTAQPVGGRELITGLGATGRAYSYQPHTGRSKYGIWMINGGSISLTADGIGAANGTGTVTARTPTLTGFASSLRRVGFVTATTLNAPAGWRLGATWFWRGDDTNRGGFHYITRFVPSNPSLTTTGRYFIGLNGANVGTAATEPSNWVNIVGMGCNSGSVNFSIMHNDGSGTATTIDLGSNFSAVSSSIDVYELALYCPPNGSTVDWRVENFTKSAVVTGSISTNLPASTQGLNIIGYTENGASSVTTALDLVSMYIETEF